MVGDPDQHVAVGLPVQVSCVWCLQTTRFPVDPTTKNLASPIVAAHDAGLEQLSRTQPAFYAYQKSLFSASTLSLDRGKLTPEEVAAVNKSIAAFLQLLSPHFLAPSCFKVLEYLIRKYRCPPLMHAALMNPGGMLLS